MGKNKYKLSAMLKPFIRETIREVLPLDLCDCITSFVPSNGMSVLRLIFLSKAHSELLTPEIARNMMLPYTWTIYGSYSYVNFVTNFNQKLRDGVLNEFYQCYITQKISDWMRKYSVCCSSTNRFNNINLSLYLKENKSICEQTYEIRSVFKHCSAKSLWDVVSKINMLIIKNNPNIEFISELCHLPNLTTIKFEGGYPHQDIVKLKYLRVLVIDCNKIVDHVVIVQKMYPNFLKKAYSQGVLKLERNENSQ